MVKIDDVVKKLNPNSMTQKKTHPKLIQGSKISPQTHLGLKKLFIVAGGDTHCRTTISTYHISKIKISLLLTLIFPSLLIFFFKTDIRGETRLFYERINIMLFFSFLVF